MDYVTITEITISPINDAPLLHCVDEAVRLAAQTGCYVLLRCINKEFLFTPRTQAKYVMAVKDAIIKYQHQKATNFELFDKSREAVTA